MSVFLGRADWTLSPLIEADFSAGGGVSPDLDGFVIDNTVPLTGSTDQQPGLWHLSIGRGNDAGHSVTHSLYYGQDETALGGGNFNVGRSAGFVDSPAVDLTAVSGAELSFNYLIETEGSPGFFDQAKVLVSIDGGTTFSEILSNRDALIEGGGSWREASYNLSAFVGQTIDLRFSFDSVDSIANQFEGWYIDDVVIRPFYTLGNPDVALSLTQGPDSVAGIGDFTGDGIDDYAVLNNDGTTHRTFIVSGIDGGGTPGSGNIADFAVTVEFSGAASTYEIYGVGNVDGDTPDGVGLDDFVISSANPAVTFATAHNESFLIFGGSLVGLVDVNNTTTVANLEAQGIPRALAVSGVSLRGLGDVNADGLSDLGGSHT